VSTREATAYIAAQLLGAAAGTIIANLMFSEPAIALSTKPRSSPGLWLGEVVATLGLLLVIFGVVRSQRPSAAPYAVGAYIGAAYWWTSSTSFANPAATLARTLSDTFAGITPASTPAFIGAELLGTAVAALVIATLYPRIKEHAAEVVVFHQSDQTLSEEAHP
jgi:glycerol uptake facilitator-like aquaporin